MKLNIQITCMAVLFGTFNFFAQNRSISFETGTWSEVIKKAQSENKPIFVDAYAVWCGPCKMMAKNTFTNDAVADYYNTNFINVKIDMEKGEGIELAKKWKIQAYPTLIYFFPSGDLMHQACGAFNPEEFLALGDLTLNTDKRIGDFTKLYNSGNRETEFLTNYLFTLSSACMDFQEPTKAYFETQKEADLTSDTNWNLIDLFITDINSREFKYLEANTKLFESKFSKEVVDNKLDLVYTEFLQKPLYTNDLTGYETAKKHIATKNNEASKKAISYMDVSVAVMQKDWKNFTTKGDVYLKKYTWNDGQTLNSFAWRIFENVKDKKSLKKAQAWAKRSVDLGANVYNLDTYAHITNALGNKKGAIEYMNKAIELAKATNDPILEELQKNLETISKD